jgi:hypothetical protein
VSYKHNAQEALGLSWDDVVNTAASYAPGFKDYLTKAGQGLKAGQAVLDDPYFGEGVCMVLRLQTLEAGKKPTAPCPRTVITAANARKGVGLRHVATPLRAAVYAREHKWVVPVAIAAALVVPVAIGYVLGRSSR